MASLKDVSAKAGVSICTVSNILNGKTDQYKYADKTIKKVFKAASDLGYVANTVARSLKTRRSGTIAVMVADITNAFYTEIIQQLEQHCQDNGQTLIICTTSESLERENETLALLASRQIDGLIISPVSESASLKGDYPFPIVQIDRQAKSYKGPFIGINNKTAAAELADAMLKQGCRRPLIIGSAAEDSSIKQRLAGFKQVMRSKKISIDRVPILNVFNSDQSEQVVSELIEAGETSWDGIFVTSHVLSMGVIKALSQSQLAISCLAGIDDLPVASFLPWTVISQVQPIAEMTDLAYRMLNDIEDTDVKKVKKSAHYLDHRLESFDPLFSYI